MLDASGRQNEYNGLFGQEPGALGPGGPDAAGDPYRFAGANSPEPLFPTLPDAPAQGAGLGAADDPFAVKRNPEPSLWAAPLPPVETPATRPVERRVPPPVSPVARPVAPAKPVSVTPPSNPNGQAFEQRFTVIANLMQHGAWPQALEQLRVLRAEYPRVASLHGLIEEATLKTELMETWAHKIKGRRLTVGQEWLLRRSLPFLLVLGLFLSSAVFYQNFVAPSREVVAMAQAIQTQIEQARESTQLGDYSQALALYETVLVRDPGNAVAFAGRAEARRLLALAVNYDIALQVADAGNMARAVRLMQSVQQTSPTFRDVGAQMGRLTGMAQAEEVFQAAEKSFAQHRWIEAVQGYEQVKLLIADYRAADIAYRLQAAYLYAGQAILDRWPAEGLGPETARDYLRLAQAAAPKDDPDAQMVAAELSDLEVYFDGADAAQREDWAAALDVWLALYAEQPGYLGGYLAEEIYRAYLTAAAQAAAQGDLTMAQQYYERALAMAVADTSEAQTRLQGLTAPTPAPTPTPQPAPVYVAPVAAAPEPTATPTPTPASSYQGWIAFRSTRDGGEAIFMMRADGSDQQRASNEVAARFAEAYASEQRAPDGRVAFVQTATGRSDANIAIRSSDGQAVTTVTNYTGDEYDPVWSPNGQWIVFVGNHTDNDELWRMNADGSDPRQLTWNNWEWDKHPTWSPDSNQIAFYSNRAGARQIWVMGNDGSGQRNLSNNAYDDWDPVWLK